MWDGINDPLIGILSDRIHTRWGRRRPFLLWFAIPFGLSFIILWSAPNWESQTALLIYVTLSFMLADTLQTLVAVPFLSLTPELTSDYDERTTLTSFRSFFQLVGALTVVVAAPAIVDMVLDIRRLTAAGIYARGRDLRLAFGAIPLLLIGLFIRETSRPERNRSHFLSRNTAGRMAEYPIPLCCGNSHAELVSGGYGRGDLSLFSALLGGAGRSARIDSYLWFRICI